MKTKLITLFLALVASVGTMFADRVKIGDLYYNLDAAKNEAEVTYSIFNSSYNYGGLECADIPDSVVQGDATYAVTSIGEKAFYYCKGIKSLTIPSSVRYIGSFAFSSCDQLTSVTFNRGEGAIFIYKYAFSNCTNLTTVNIRGDIGTWLETYFEDERSNPLECAHNLYLNGNLVTDLILPDSITSIPSYAFAGCSSLTSIVGNYVTRIGAGAFRECTNLLQVTFPSFVQSAIEDFTFYRCRKLTSFTIPNSVTTIKKSAFLECKNLKSIVISKNVTSIASYAFNYCDSIKMVEWDAKNCNLWNFGSQVETFILGDSVEVIPDSLCKGMNKLTSITIPVNVTYIGDDALRGCTNIQSVQWNAKNCMSSPFRRTNNHGGVVYDIRSQITSFTFGNKVKNIPALLCSGINATSIEIPNSVTSIGNDAFYGCGSLTSVTIPNSVTSIGNGAFSDCSVLTSLTIPENVTYIGKCAFQGCSNITSVIWNAKNASTSDDIFKDCTNITSVIWNAKNASTSDDIFKDCKNKITSFEFGDKVTYVPDFLCSNLKNVASIIIPQSVKYIGEEAFHNCTNVTVVPSGVLSVGANSFSGCSNLTSLSPNLQSIGDSAFLGCSKITEVTFPAKELTIGSDAFSGCNIKSVYIVDLAKWCQSNFPSPYGWDSNSYHTGRYFNGIKLFNDSTIIYINGKELHDLVVPTTCTSVARRAFESYAGLRSATFHSRISTLGEHSFAACHNLKTIICHATTPPNITTKHNYGGSITTEFETSALGCITNLYVPQNAIVNYKNSKDWCYGTIFSIQNAIETNEDDVKATPTTNNSVIIQWPFVDGADTYTIEIQKDGEVICSLTFDSQGQLLRVSHAIRARCEIPQNITTANEISVGWQYTIEDLEPATQYTYTVSVKNSEDTELFAQSLNFSTYAEGMENTASIQGGDRGRLIFHKGQILILRGSHTYTLTGQEIK